MQPTAARSPALNFLTAAPTFVTPPTISSPGTQGYTVGITPLHSSRTWWRSEWQIPQNRISICTSCSVGSRRVTVVGASGDALLRAAEAFAVYMGLCSYGLLDGRLRANSLDVHCRVPHLAAVQRPVICSSFSGYRAPWT